MNKKTIDKTAPTPVCVYEFIVHRKKVSAVTDTVTNGAQVARFCQETIYNEDEMWREKAVAIYLNKASRIIGYEVVSIGGPNSCNLDPKMICRTAVQMMADGVIVVHNHPSGDPTPSQSDLLQTEKLRKALATLDTKLLDSVIITESTRYFSFTNDKEARY